MAKSRPARSLLIAVAVAMMVLAACTGTDESAIQDVPEGAWLLRELAPRATLAGDGGYQPLTAVPAGSGITATFERHERVGYELVGRACVNYRHPVSIEGNQLRFHLTVAEGFGCETQDGESVPSDEYLYVLTEVARYEIEGDIMRFYTIGDNLVMVFDRTDDLMTSQDVPGGAWLLIEFSPGPGRPLQSLPPGGVITAGFESTGRIRGAIGACFNYGFPVEVDGNRLNVGTAVIRGSGCGTADGQIIPADEYLRMLQEHVAQFQLSDTEMHILDQTGTVIAVFEPTDDLRLVEPTTDTT